MDDFNVSSLHESKNEWCARLLTILTPFVVEGLKSIFDEAFKLCRDNGEGDKYLMTFQNFVSRIPKWNANIIELERKRIIERSGCSYLEDLITCVHIIQLKLLSAARAGQKQKKIDVNIPKLDDFIHKTYINVARKIYKNVYLFETNIVPLQVQKNHRELEIIVQECILNTVRESIPVETILRAYMDESVEDNVTEEIKEEVIVDPEVASTNSTTDNSVIVKEGNDVMHTESGREITKISTNVPADEGITTGSTEFGKLSFNDVDRVRDVNNMEETIRAPKDYDSLEAISNMRNAQRKLEEEEEDNNNGSDSGSNVRLTIFGDESVKLNNLDVHVIDPPELNLIPDLLLDDFEVLV